MNLTHSQLVDILAESFTMRSIAAEIVLSSPLVKNYLVKEVELVVRESVLNSDFNKISAIKKVRELAEPKDIYPLFPTVEWNFSPGPDNVLGLGDAKRLVEHVANYLGISF